MKGLPKRFATADDIRNCHELVKSGEISKAEMLEAMEQLEEQNYLHCPIRAVNGDTVTIGYCAEATAGGDAVVDGRELAIVSVTHNKGEAEEAWMPDSRQLISNFQEMFQLMQRRLRSLHLTISTISLESPRKSLMRSRLI